MFPERMRALRMGRGLTLEQLAQELNQMDVSYKQKKIPGRSSASGNAASILRPILISGSLQSF